MQIVAIADTHGDHADLGVLPAGDVLIHAGDVGWEGDLAEFKLFADWFGSQPHAIKILVAGNHDRCLAYQREEAVGLLGSDVFYLEDEGVTIDGLVFWGSPWQPAYDAGAFLLPRGRALAEKCDLIPANVDVLVTHGPPLGFGDRTNGARNGCKILLKAVRRVRPTLHVFGHVHYDGGTWDEGGVRFGNVTTWESCRRASIFDLDLTVKVVTSVEIPPRHVV